MTCSSAACAAYYPRFCAGERKELDTTEQVEDQVLENVLRAAAAPEDSVQRAKKAWTANAGASVRPGKKRRRRRPPWFKAWKAVQDQKDALKVAAATELAAPADATSAAMQKQR